MTAPQKNKGEKKMATKTTDPSATALSHLERLSLEGLVTLLDVAADRIRGALEGREYVNFSFLHFLVNVKTVVDGKVLNVLLNHNYCDNVTISEK